jgi:SAM-dependent methyltransferase
MPNAHDSWAWVYDEVYEKSFGSFYTNLTSQTLSVVDGLLAPGSSILDVGAGTGRLAIPLSERGYGITAIDASKTMLDVLRSKDTASLIHTIHSRLQDLALKDQFDFVCCVFSVFCYITTEGELDAAIDAICRHTKPSGKILIDVAALGSFTGIDYQSEDLIRTVVVEEEDPDHHLFRYSETVQKSGPEGIEEFKDDFLIKYWDHELILNKFAENAFRGQLSMSHHFIGSGALYFLVGKH